MAFPIIETPIPISIKEMYLPLFRVYYTPPGGEEVMSQGASYKFHVLWNDGHFSRVEGDLVPYLTPEDIAWLIDFADRIWAKAELELLPP